MITETTTPNTRTSAYREVVWTLDSPADRLICDVYIDNNYITTVERDPYPGSDKFHIDIQDVAMDEVLVNYQDEYLGNRLIVEDNDSSHLAKLEVFEINELAAGTSTNWTNNQPSGDITSTAVYINNTIVQHDEDIDLGDYLKTSSAQGQKFLSNRPRGQWKIDKNGKFQLDFLCHEQKTWEGIINVYDVNGNLLVSPNISTKTPKSKARIEIDSSTLNQDRSYCLMKVEGDSSQWTEELRIDFTEENEEKVRIDWLNPLGGIDWYYFNPDEKTVRKEEITYDEKVTRLDGAAQDSDWNSYDRGRKILKSESNKTIKVVSDPEKEDVIEWLSEVSWNGAFVIEHDTQLPLIVEDVVKFYDKNSRQMRIAVTYRYANKQIGHKTTGLKQPVA